MATLGERIGIQIAFNGTNALSGMKRVDSALRGLKRLIIAVFTGKTINDMARFGREMYSMSLRTGISAQKLNSLRNAFIAAGSGAKGFEKTIGNISAGLRGLSLGRGDFAAKLGMIGISPYTAEGKLKTADETLYDIADWAKSQEGIMPKEQILYMMNELFGIDTELGEKLLGGSEQFRREQEEANRRIGEINSGTIESLKNLKQGLDELWGSLKILSVNFFGKLAKHIQPVIDLFRSVFVWLSQDSELLENFGKVLGFLVKTITFIASVIAGIIGGLAAAVGAFIGWIASKFMGGNKMEAMNKSIQEYRGENGRLDIGRMKKDFREGKISKEKDELQYYAALNILRQSDPKMYQEKWEQESFNNTMRMAELGFKPETTYKAESLFDGMPMNVEQVTNTNNEGNVTKNVNIQMEQNFNGQTNPSDVRNANDEMIGRMSAVEFVED